mmetsp:Transcript_24755/g.56955  ORF Transcript_24755/g.56955 Transcript_24755/m.56955 type:complete len:307 (+) Transcript_24755:161-1081(+)
MMNKEIESKKRDRSNPPSDSFGHFRNKVPLAKCRFELSIGSNAQTKTHYIEIVRHVRRTDLDWWASDLQGHNGDLLNILSEQILPLPHVAGDLVRDYWIDSTSSEKARSSGTAGGKKRKNSKGSKKSDPLDSESTSNALASSIAHSIEYASNAYGLSVDEASVVDSRVNSTKKAKKSKVGNSTKSFRDDDVAIAFGKNIQIAYRIEEIEGRGDSATLSWKENAQKLNGARNSNDAAHVGSNETGIITEDTVTFQSLRKISCRIILWCYKLNKNDIAKPFPEHNFDEMKSGENIESGFLRKNYLPIT